MQPKAANERMTLPSANSTLCLLETRDLSVFEGDLVGVLGESIGALLESNGGGTVDCRQAGTVGDEEPEHERENTEHLQETDGGRREIGVHRTPQRIQREEKTSSTCKC